MLLLCLDDVPLWLESVCAKNMFFSTNGTPAKLFVYRCDSNQVVLLQLFWLTAASEDLEQPWKLFLRRSPLSLSPRLLCYLPATAHGCGHRSASRRAAGWHRHSGGAHRCAAEARRPAARQIPVTSLQTRPLPLKELPTSSVDFNRWLILESRFYS